MKNFFIIILAAAMLAGCKDNTKQEKDLLNDILKVHDKVMITDEALMKNKMRLDSLLKLPAKDTAEKVNLKAIDIKLIAASEAMETWMNKFQPDMTGKSHDEIMKYYKDQKKEILSVDSQMNVAITESNKYFSNKKIK
ncbi:MAG TPA: hypothetical protein VK668_02085 [Mucilaginibacter sp.]|nr:hypothetical protein [Mucilaginibacter sp.]